MLLDSTNSYGWSTPKIIDTSVYHNTEWCRNYLGRDLCGGHMYPTGEIDYNKLHPNLEFFRLKCEICEDERWSEPKEKQNIRGEYVD